MCIQYIAPLVHSRQVCLDRVCMPQWSEARAQTSQAEKTIETMIKQVNEANFGWMWHFYKIWTDYQKGKNQSISEYTLAPVFRSRKHPVPYLKHKIHTTFLLNFSWRRKRQHGHNTNLKTHKATYVFLACPSWKHICPTSAADWSPRHLF